MSSYTTQAKVEAYLQRTLTSQEAVMLPLAIKHVSAQINSYTNREWWDVPAEGDPETPDAESRLFDGTGQHELEIGDASAVETIEVLDNMGGVSLSIEDADDYVMYPLNSDYIESISMRSNIFPNGAARIRVTAVWGAGPAPEEVQLAATIMAGKFVGNMGATAGSFKSESIEGYSYTLKSDVETNKENEQLLMTLGHLKRYSL